MSMFGLINKRRLIKDLKLHRDRLQKSYGFGPGLDTNQVIAKAAANDWDAVIAYGRWELLTEQIMELEE